MKKGVSSRGGVNRERENFSICTPPPVASSAPKGKNVFLLLPPSVDEDVARQVFGMWPANVAHGGPPGFRDPKCGLRWVFGTQNQNVARQVFGTQNVARGRKSLDTTAIDLYTSKCSSS